MLVNEPWRSILMRQEVAEPEISALLFGTTHHLVFK
jgi:hypothetical protein